jgi:hypothetical protein
MKVALDTTVNYRDGVGIWRYYIVSLPRGVVTYALGGAGLKLELSGWCGVEWIFVRTRRLLCRSLAEAGDNSGVVKERGHLRSLGDENGTAESVSARISSVLPRMAAVNATKEIR